MGGAAKRMMHPYDNLDLTFSDMTRMIQGVADGDITCFEKFDGTNLVWSVNDKGEPRYARKTDQTLTGGMSYDEFIFLLKGHPAEHIFSAGARAVRDLTRTHGSPTDLEANTWVNCEILLKDHPQMIRYDNDSIVLHKLMTPTKVGKKVVLTDVTPKFQRKWELFIMRAYILGLRDWKVYGPMKLTVESTPEIVEAALTQLRTVSSKVDVEDPTLRDYLYSSTVAALVYAASVSEEHAHQLAENVTGRGRWKIRDIKSHYSPYVCGWIDKIALSKNRDKWINNVMMPVKKCWERFGASLLAETCSTLIKDSDAGRERLRDLIAWNQLKLDFEYRDEYPQTREEFHFHLSRFESLNVAPPVSEGLVFSFEQNTYKVTGAFPSLNRATGAVRYEIGEMYDEKETN